MLVRGKYVITDPSQDNDGVVEEGAVCIRGNLIVAVGTYSRLAELYPNEDEIGSDEYVVLPGLINAHDHGRAPSSFQLGVADDYLEIWLMALMGQRTINPYLATAYASMQLIESGVTTVLHSYYDPNLTRNESTLENTIKAYEQAGLRTALAMGILDESPINSLCRKLLPSLSARLKGQVSDFMGQRSYLSVDDFFAIFRTWHQEYNKKESGRIRVLLGPVSVHWCSKDLLVRIQKEAEATQTAIQAHVLETIYQREQALRKHGKTVIAWLAEIGLLSSLLSCAHCVWVTDNDIDLLAETRTSVVHNPSSNLRLRSGIAPLNIMLQRGVNVALGMDSHTLNDDGDMLQEMRLAANLHRVPEVGAYYPPTRQMLAMATKSGAKALLLDEEVGVLEVGKKADLILVRLNTLCFPYVDPRQDIMETLLYRGKAQDVDTVIIDGQVVMQGRRLLTLDKEAIVAELQNQLKYTQNQQGESLGQMIDQLKPYVRSHYQDESRLLSKPYYLFNSREV